MIPPIQSDLLDNYIVLNLEFIFFQLFSLNSVYIGWIPFLYNVNKNNGRAANKFLSPPIQQKISLHRHTMSLLFPYYISYHTDCAKETFLAHLQDTQ